MSLEEEILIHQFGQGVRSLTDMLEQFRALATKEQRHRFVFLYCELNDYTSSNTDIEQALADLSSEDAGAMYDYLYLRRFTAKRTGIVVIPSSDAPPNGRLDVAYQVLLVLFKLNYQWRFAPEQGNPTAWQYQDLSDPVVVQGILTMHRNLVEKVYADPSYRSEFACLAKIWREDELRHQTPELEPDDKVQTHFDFLTYDELVTNMIAVFYNETRRGLVFLRQSLGNALSKQYSLNLDQVNRLIMDVVAKHLQEI